MSRASRLAAVVGSVMLLGAANRPLEVISRLYVPMVEMLTVSTASAQEGTSSRAVPAPGVDTVLDARAKAISSRLRCPVCQGESIQDSPAELAAQMKGLVREQIVNGRSDVEVLDYFTQKYGQWILLEPQAQGLNLIVYWIPVLFLVIGGGVLWMVVRKWTRPRTVVDGDLSIDAIDITQK